MKKLAEALSQVPNKKYAWVICNWPEESDGGWDYDGPSRILAVYSSREAGRQALIDEVNSFITEFGLDNEGSYENYAEVDDDTGEATAGQPARDPSELSSHADIMETNGQIVIIVDGVGTWELVRVPLY